MQIIRAGAAIVLVGSLAGCATHGQAGQKGAAQPMPSSAEVNVTHDLTYRYGEVQIAVNPKNPNNLVYADVQLGFTYACQTARNPDCDVVQVRLGGGGNQGGILFPQPKGLFSGHAFAVTGVFTSFDRGKTWKRVSVPVPSPQYPDLRGWGDPSVVATSDGTFYLSYDNMDWGTPEKPLPKSMVGVSKSTDGGFTWSSPVPAGTAIDGPKMTVDRNADTIYEASGGNRELVSSKDGVTWTSPQRIGGSDGTRQFSPGIGGNAMSAAHGALAFVFRATDAAACAYFVGGAAPCVVFQTTTDAGATWSRHRVPVTAPMGNPTMAADPSKKDHFTVAVLNQGDTQFQVFQTNDAGKTWSGPTTVTENATKQHYHAWMAYSPTGVVGLMWRTRQPAPGQNATAPAATPAGPGGGPALPYNVWAAISRDGGATFSEPLKVSSADSPAADSATFGNFGDDYSSIVLDRDYAYVGWADWRPGDRSGFFRAIKLSEFEQKH